MPTCSMPSLFPVEMLFSPHQEPKRNNKQRVTIQHILVQTSPCHVAPRIEHQSDEHPSASVCQMQKRLGNIGNTDFSFGKSDNRGKRGGAN